MIVKYETKQSTHLSDDIDRKILARDGKLMVVEYSFKKGAVAPIHSHPHEQVGYVVKGKVELDLDSKKECLSPGDSYYVNPNALHGAVALEDSVLVDVFTPQREDLL